MPAITSLDLSNAKLDVDHIADIATSTDYTATDRLGHVKNTMVGAVASIMAFNSRGSWSANTSYSIKDLVSVSGTWYVAVVAHTSGTTFADDVASKWRIYQGVTLSDLADQNIANSIGYISQGVGAVPTTVAAKLGHIVSVKDFGAILDGITDDSLAVQKANAVAVATKALLFFPAIARIGTATTITAKLMQENCQIFTTSSNVTVDNGMLLRPEWWGADPTNTADSLAAWQACVAVAKGREIKISGVYKFSNTLVIDFADTAGLKITGGGASLLSALSLSSNKFALNFDGVPAGQNALDIKRVRGLTLGDFFVSHRAGGGGGVSVHLTALDDFKISGVDVESNNGSGSSVFRFGETNGVDCAFNGSVSNCKVISNGQPSFDIRPTCTSITIKNCYQLGGYYLGTNAVYCSYINCGSEYAPLYGYILNGCVGIVYNSCGGEANGRGLFYTQGACSSITYINPFGAGNNTSANTNTGDLIHMDGSTGANTGISIINPVSFNCNAATTTNIKSDGENLYTEISNTLAISLPKGISGTPTWRLKYLTVTGELEVFNFTPSLTNWTIVNTPQLVGNYIKKGKVIHFWINVGSPVSGGSVSTTNYISTIQLPWDTLGMSSVAACVISNNSGSSNCVIDANGVIRMPAIAPTGFSIFITGTLYIS